MREVGQRRCAAAADPRAPGRHRGVAIVVKYRRAPVDYPQYHLMARCATSSTPGGPGRRAARCGWLSSRGRQRVGAERQSVNSYRRAYLAIASIAGSSRGMASRRGEPKSGSAIDRLAHRGQSRLTRGLSNTLAMAPSPADSDYMTRYVRGCEGAGQCLQGCRSRKQSN
jgi:hypothetical protein